MIVWVAVMTEPYEADLKQLTFATEALALEQCQHWEDFDDYYEIGYNTCRVYHVEVRQAVVI